jgi:broad specificity phosphatase PhoE
VLDPRWREVGVGEWQGRPLAELPPGGEPSWRGGPLVPPGGETWQQMAARVAEAVEDLRDRGGSWLVVCHGGTIRAAVAHLTGADARRIAGPANASVTVIGVDGERSRPAQLHAFAWTPDGAVPGL